MTTTPFSSATPFYPLQYSNKNIYENITSNNISIFIKLVSSIEIENIVYNCDSKYSTDSHDFNFF